MRNGLSLGRLYPKPHCDQFTESELPRQHGTGSGRSACAIYRVQLSERTNARWACDIGQSMRTALVSGIVQKDQAVADLSVRLPTNGRSVHVCYSAIIVSLTYSASDEPTFDITYAL
jgi:hypothetical protein